MKMKELSELGMDELLTKRRDLRQGQSASASTTAERSARAAKQTAFTAGATSQN